MDRLRSEMAPKKTKQDTPELASSSATKRKAIRKAPAKSPPAKRQKTESSESDVPEEFPLAPMTSVPVAKAHDVKATFNLKISSWNVNGIRSWCEKKGLSFLQSEKPDIFCLQETKCTEDKLPSALKNLEGYHAFWSSGDKPGYSGVGILSKIQPIKVTYGIDIVKHDGEGRVITAEYEKFYLVTAYVPNSGRGLINLNYRMEWDEDFFAYLKTLSEEKGVILCGDLNVAHQEIDIANPSSNKRNAGFTKEERESFGALLEDGFTDTFRYLYPDVKDVYSFWTFMRNARAKNVGWRLDYFICSSGMADNIHDSLIHTDVMGSDHCPVSLLLEI